MKTIYSFQQGSTPFLLSIPHAGTLVPPDISERLNAEACQLPDTDWYVDRLYNWVTELGVGMLTASYSRYVIDLNRPPDDTALYSRSGTGLVPEYSFQGKPLYRPGMALTVTETATRKDHYWQPYHDKIYSELHRLRQRHGYAVLLDAHSIRTEVPLLFDGSLPDLNLGSHKGASAAPGLVALTMEALGSKPEYSLVLDGRFQGGYITRHYGKPAEGFHALQLEMAQSVYMNEHSTEFDDKRFTSIQPVLRRLIESILHWSPANE